ncbi:MAG: hypothetical protein HUU03_12050 [Planctomycetaceae bacterium]|nr:hypothetical protein [Planctomycetaceae bacterium]
MAATNPQWVICTYQVKKGRQRAFEALLARHWKTLKRLKLVHAKSRPQYFRGQDPKGPVFVEIFAWLNEKAPDLAHHSPEVMAIWEPMMKLCRDMRFPHVERFSPKA